MNAILLTGTETSIILLWDEDHACGWFAEIAPGDLHLNQIQVVNLLPWESHGHTDGASFVEFAHSCAMHHTAKLASISTAFPLHGEPGCFVLHHLQQIQTDSMDAVTRELLRKLSDEPSRSDCWLYLRLPPTGISI